MAQVYLPDERDVWSAVKIVKSEGEGGRLVVRRCVGAPGGAVSSDEEEVALGKEDRALLERVVGRSGAAVGGGASGTAASAFPLVNVGKIGKVDNLVDLNFLHEPAILFALRERFAAQTPYTRTGNIIVAVNPYQWIDNLYGKDLGLAYLERELRCLQGGRQRSDDAASLRPHVYFVSSRAFADMVGSKKSQSILVSGESGAGKTETTKIVITHLVGSSEHMQLAQGPSAESKAAERDTPASRVLGSNHLLEAFGNAKTVRNDNSSRFGKYTSLQFDARSHSVLGCKAQVYLLEKSRVVTQSPAERNYHIFYQLLRGAPLDTLSRLGLTRSDGAGEVRRASPADFPYLASGSHTVEGVDDAEQFSRTVEGLGCVGALSDKTDAMLASIASVLHLGRLPVQSQGDDASTVGGLDAVGIEDGREQDGSPATTVADLPLRWCSELLGEGLALVDALCLGRGRPYGDLPSTVQGEGRDAPQRGPRKRSVLARVPLACRDDQLVHRVPWAGWQRRRRFLRGLQHFHPGHFWFRKFRPQQLRAAVHQLRQRKVAAEVHQRRVQERAGRVRCRGYRLG